MEWLDPPFTAGHWVPEMVRPAGSHDDLAREGFPSSQIAWGRIVDYDPEIIVLMPCGLTLERTIEEFGEVEFPEAWYHLAAVQSRHVYAVNGSAYFNRPGPRIVGASRSWPRLFTRRWSREPRRMKRGGVSRTEEPSFWR